MLPVLLLGLCHTSTCARMFLLLPCVPQQTRVLRVLYTRTNLCRACAVLQQTRIPRVLRASTAAMRECQFRGVLF